MHGAGLRAQGGAVHHLEQPGGREGVGCWAEFHELHGSYTPCRAMGMGWGVRVNAGVYVGVSGLMPGFMLGCQG